MYWHRSPRDVARTWCHWADTFWRSPNSLHSRTTDSTPAARAAPDSGGCYKTWWFATAVSRYSRLPLAQTLRSAEPRRIPLDTEFSGCLQATWTWWLSLSPHLRWPLFSKRSPFVRPTSLAPIHFLTVWLWASAGNSISSSRACPRPVASA